MAARGSDSTQVHEPAHDGIVTPDAVVLELDTAGIASRLTAGLLDVAVQFGLLIVALIALRLAGLASESSSDGRVAQIVTTTLVLLGYPVVLETLWRGRTVGKYAVGLRVVTLEGAPVTVRHALLRMIGGLVDRFLPPGGVTGLLFVLGTKRRQRVGDLLAGTIVIRDPDRLQLPTALWFPVPVGHEAYAATIDPTAMTVEQYTVIRAFLVRVKELTPDARFSVATTLADALARTIHHTRPQSMHPEAFLLCAIARYQRRAFPHHQPAAWQSR